MPRGVRFDLDHYFAFRKGNLRVDHWMLRDAFSRQAFKEEAFKENRVEIISLFVGRSWEKDTYTSNDILVMLGLFLVGSLEDIARLLVQQQFYDEKEKVVDGRTKDVRIHVSGVNPVLTTLLNEIMGPIALQQAKNYAAYLAELAMILTFNSRRVMIGFYRTLENIDREDITDFFAATFLIGELLSGIRENEFKNMIEEVKFLIQQQYTLPDACIDEKLSFLQSINDETVSLLANLALLRMLALAFGSPDFGKQLSSIWQKYVNMLIEKLTNDGRNA